MHVSRKPKPKVDPAIFRHVRHGTIEKYTIMPDLRTPYEKKNNLQSAARHHLLVNGKWYSFYVHGWQQWAFKSDTLSFRWDWDASHTYRNIIYQTLRAHDSKGEPVVRGGADPQVHRIEWRVRIDKYVVNQTEDDPQSLSLHTLSIDGERYRFWAEGSVPWADRRDAATFRWEDDSSGSRTRWIIPTSFRAHDRSGRRVSRTTQVGKSEVRTEPSESWHNVGVAHLQWLVLGSDCCGDPNGNAIECSSECLLRQ